MLEDASSALETTPETVVDAPASQPVQGNETPAALTTPEPSHAQGQGAQQPSPMIPKYRFDEVNHRAQAAEARLRELMATPQPAPAAPQAPKQEEFNSYEDYIRADARFVAQQEVRQTLAQDRQQEQQSRQQQAEQARVMNAETNWGNKSYEAASKYPDFEQKISMAAPLTNPYAVQVMKASPVAGDLAYHLASNHELVNRLNGMHPLDVAAELGRIEGKLAGSTTPPHTRASKAPPPISPVGNGKTSAAQSYSDGMSQEEFNASFKPIW